MRILTVSDKVEPVLYGPYIRERVGQIDLVLACGDIPYYYLEYIVGLLDAPLYYVHGNHDKEIPQPSLVQEAGVEPGGFWWAESLHLRTVGHKGLLLAGLEGCRMYNPRAPFQYSEGDVRRQTFFLGRRLLMNRVRHGRYLDILMTHAPPRGIHDGEDLPHQGFESYLGFLRRYQPLLMVHGHQHVYNRNEVSETDYYGTHIVNTYGYRVIELKMATEQGGWRLVSVSGQSG
jgi:Icc-related predicted phosphoesterase